MNGGHLNLSSLCLDVPPHCLCSVVLGLSSLNLSNSDISLVTLQSVLCLALWSTSFSSLDLTGQDLSDVDSQLMADAVSALDSLNISSCRVSSKLIGSLCYSLRQDYNTLEHLSLACVDLSQINGNVLSRSFFYLTSLSLSYSKLSTEQLTALLRGLAKTSNLINLELAGQDLKKLATPFLTRLVTFPSSLERLNLNHSNLTSCHC